MLLWIKIFESGKVLEVKDPAFIQKAIDVGKLGPQDLIGKDIAGPWNRLDSVDGLVFNVSNNEAYGIGAPQPKQQSKFRSLTNFFRRGATSARQALDNAVAETQRAVDDKDRIIISESVTIGRSAEYSDWVVPDPHVAAAHTRVTNENGVLTVTGLKSQLGTLVNGQILRTKKPHVLSDGDLLQIGSAGFTVDGISLLSTARTDHAHIECEALTRVVDTEDGKKKTILNNVSLNIPPKSFVVLLGPSGSGKSTLLNAINGRTTATTGDVWLNKADLYANYNRLRSRIANVPQKDILHFELPLETSLAFTAALKLPNDMDNIEKSQAVNQALTEVGMHALKTESMKKYSGGQIKRASVAHEILSNPSLVCVDEATSGLDEHSDREIMSLLRDIADGGKTILCITHNLGNVAEFSDTLVVMAEGGYLAFCGSPQDAMLYFEITDLSQLYIRLRDNPGETWAVLWSVHIQSDIEASLNVGKIQRDQLSIHKEKISTLQHFGIMLRHGRVVMRRIRALVIRDRTSLLVMTLQPALVFLVIWLLFGEVGSAGEEMNVAFLLIVCTFWFGCSNSAKEIVKERPVFEKERHGGLNAFGYLGAKAFWLIGVTLVQSFTLFMFTKFATGLPLDFPSAFMGITAIAICGVGLGLCISVLSKNTDVAVSAVPLAIIPQVILGGLLKAPDGVSEFIAWIGVPCYWGFGLFLNALTENWSSEVITAIAPDLYSTENIWISLAAILFVAVILLTVSALSLSGVKVGGEFEKLNAIRMNKRKLNNA